jgi:hypothetical protein
MSGLDSSSLHSAMRRFSPPDRFLIDASQGGRRSASAAIPVVLAVGAGSGNDGLQLALLLARASKSASGSA